MIMYNNYLLDKFYPHYKNISYWSCADSPSKSADGGHNMSSHDRFKVLWQKKSAFYSLSAFLKLWSIQTSKVHAKLCFLSVCLYQAIIL